MIENEQCFQESAVASFVLMSFLILWAFLSLSLPPLPHSLFPSSPPTHCQLVSVYMCVCVFRSMQFLGK